MKELDYYYDLLVYSVIALCFLSASALIVKSITDIYAGWHHHYLIEAGALLAFGIVLSLFLSYLKSLTIPPHQ